MSLLLSVVVDAAIIKQDAFTTTATNTVIITPQMTHR
jgi:hypothetical protein